MNAHIAQTILEQLGGRQFQAMTGARDFVALESGLMFKVGRNDAGVSTIRVLLSPADDYTVEAWVGRGLNATLLTTHDGVYCDNLRDVFESLTGLRTSL